MIARHPRTTIASDFPYFVLVRVNGSVASPESNCSSANRSFIFGALIRQDCPPAATDSVQCPESYRRWYPVVNGFRLSNRGVRLCVKPVSIRAIGLLFRNPIFVMYVRVSQTDRPDFQSALCGVPCFNLGARLGRRIGRQKEAQRVREGHPWADW